ncbi:MAG: cell filamentation protein Fic [Methylococcales symbiont of Hymedesmia sp. n. MRB-2018]|nr:MAG: cell filamentation protein Fic [Methylococcales symbiont of Hymedesmia sp. n. MRB-2018]KAF3983839.1 MAG: cell filamentation protein Fic [Methylococcales symbiont of Hymedesmia sp. n. MRB-2018]
MDKYGTDPDLLYCYEGTDILKNKFDIRDDTILKEAEREITTVAMSQIRFSQPPYNFNSLKKIHKTLFIHLYEWAGAIRRVDISKDSTRFCLTNRIEPEANKIFKDLQEDNYFNNLSRDEFIGKMAKLYSDLNMIHPFREGNGRTQRFLFENIALNLSYIIDWGLASKSEWIDANISGVNCDYIPLQNIFKKAIKSVS